MSWWILLSALVLQILLLPFGMLVDACKTAAMPRFSEDLQVLLGWFLEKPVVELSESVFIASDRTAVRTITARGCFKVKGSLV